MGVYRPGVTVHDIPGGSRAWLMARPAPPGVPEGELPTTCLNRVFMLSAERPTTRADVGAALERAGELGCRRVFFWLSPWLCDHGTVEAMREVGASPFVANESIALARRAGACADVRPSQVEVRAVSSEESSDVLRPLAEWFSADGVNTGMLMIKSGLVELFAAFAPNDPHAVAIGFLRVDGPYAYLCAAGTNPAHRGRGAQSALIRARLAAASARGAAWCTCETNTAAKTSLNNLRRCGFVDCIVWTGFRWDAPV